MSEKLNSKLFLNYQINKLKLKNRIVMAPIYLGPRFFTPEFNDFFIRRAEGGTGLLIVSIPTFGGINDLCTPEFVEKSASLIDKCHSYGCKVIPQIFSGVGEAVNRITADELARIPEDFAHGASYIQKAGFDGIEIHGAHHSLFMHLLSPLLNQRTDDYGESFSNKTRLQLLTVRKIRETTGPDFPILFRFSATEFVENGVDLATTTPYAVLLENAGSDCIHITAGGTQASPRYSDCPDHTFPEGCFSDFSFQIKQKINIPVIVAGRIFSRKTAEMILDNYKADLVSLCRPLVADPDWPKKVMDGEEHSIISADEWYDVYKKLEK